MEYEEYMSSLTEQIHDKRAKRLAAAEIGNHIEEQCEMYEREGMTHEDAVREAVRQMGNPVETGIALNKIHKPKMPWIMLGLVICMMTAAVIMQAIVSAEGARMGGNVPDLISALVYNAAGLAIILFLLYMDYNFIGRCAYLLYGLYMAGLPLYLILGHIFFSGIQISTGYYGIKMLFPIIFAGLIYRNRNREVSGVGICLALGMLEVCWYYIAYNLLGRTYCSINAAQAESVLIMGIMLVFSIEKGIFGRNKKKQIGIILGIAGSLLLVGAILCGIGAGLNTYMWQRILAVFDGKTNDYMSALLQTSMEQASWFGGQEFLRGVPDTETYNAFLLNSIFTYLGKAAGILVIAAYVLFLLIGLRISYRQSNRIGFLVGTACTVGISVRFVSYLAINLGYGLWWTTLVPFLSYGKISAVMNGIYIGLILSVYRNSSILREETIPQKRLPRIRLVIE